MEIFGSVSNAFGAINWSYILPIVYGIVAFFVVILIRSFVLSLHAMISFRNSLYISMGTCVRIPTATGHVDGEITFVNRSVIIVENKELRIIIPTKTFRERDWVVLKKEALLP